MKNLPIRLKLILATVPSLFILIGCVVFFSIQLNNINSQAKETYYDKLYTINSALINADRDFYQSLKGATSFFESSWKANKGYAPADPNLEEYISDYEENAQQVADHAAEVFAIAKTDKDLWTGTKTEDGRTFEEVAAEFDTAFAEWKESYNPSADGIDDVKYTDFSNKFPVARDHINTLQEITESWADKETVALGAKIKKSITTSVIIFAIIAVIMSLWATALTKQIGNGLREVSEKLVHLSKYDLSQDSIKVDSNDEIGKMKKAFNDTQEALKNIIGTLKNTSDGLLNASNTMSTGTQATASGVDGVSSASLDLANTSTAMAQDVTDISSNVAELGSIMERSVSSAAALSEASKEIGNVTKEGNKVVEELADINNKSLSAFQSIFDAISAMEKSAAEISSASEMISSIANQTNLLSLNASIEAARAGDAGRGFAVVADEIRQLSDQSKESVEQINEILGRLQESTNGAIEKSNTVKNMVDKQNEAVAQTKESFASIVASVATVEGAISDIEMINSELSTKSRVIEESVTSLSAISEENAATSQELSATAQTVQMNVDNLKTTQGDVESSSGGLSEIVGRFILSGQARFETEEITDTDQE